MKKKGKKTLFIVAGIVVSIVFLGFLARSSQNNSASSYQDQPFTAEVVNPDSVVTILENNVDLGEIPIRGGDVEAHFTFRNEGAEPLVLNQGQTSCMCTEAIVKKQNGEETPRIKMPGHGSSGAINMTIEPGEEVTVVAIYDPMAHGPKGTGPIKRDVVLNTNSETDPQLRFSFIGNVVR